jgi:hypothetical protein
MPYRSSKGDKQAKVRHRLTDKHGLNVSVNAALPEDEGLGKRERRGLQKENQKAYGRSWAGHAIHDRVNGDMLGRKNR